MSAPSRCTGTETHLATTFVLLHKNIFQVYLGFKVDFRISDKRKEFELVYGEIFAKNIHYIKSP